MKVYCILSPLPHITRKKVLMNKEQYVVYSIPSFTSLLLCFPNYQMDRGIFIPSGHRVLRPGSPCPARLPVSLVLQMDRGIFIPPGHRISVRSATRPPVYS